MIKAILVPILTIKACLEKRVVKTEGCKTGGLWQAICLLGKNQKVVKKFPFYEVFFLFLSGQKSFFR
jgi:hypothetical protein